MSDHVSDHEQEQNFDVLRSLSTCKIFSLLNVFPKSEG